MASKKEIIAKGNRVQRLISNKDLSQAFKDVENAIITKWMESSQEDEAGHKYLKQAILVLSSVKANLYQAIENGKVETFKLEQEENVVPFLGDLSWQKKNQK